MEVRRYLSLQINTQEKYTVEKLSFCRLFKTKILQRNFLNIFREGIENGKQTDMF